MESERGSLEPNPYAGQSLEELKARQAELVQQLQYQTGIMYRLNRRVLREIQTEIELRTIPESYGLDPDGLL